MHLKMITQGLKQLYKAIEILKEMNMGIDSAQMYFIHNTLAYCYNEKRNYQQMIENWEFAKKYLE